MAITISIIIKGSSLLFEALNEIGAHKCFLPEDRLKVKMIQTQKVFIINEGSNSGTQ